MTLPIEDYQWSKVNHFVNFEVLQIYHLFILKARNMLYDVSEPTSVPHQNNL